MNSSSEKKNAMIIFLGCKESVIVGISICLTWPTLLNSILEILRIHSWTDVLIPASLSSIGPLSIVGSKAMELKWLEIAFNSKEKSDSPTELTSTMS